MKIKTGNNIYYTTGRVGIGTSNPQSVFNIKLPADNTFNGLRIDNSSGDHRIVAYTDTTDNAYLQLKKNLWFLLTDKKWSLNF